ncbi:MAG: dynamin family protein [Prevotella sp.]|nr:dynamin family protein [Prevotella sp.]
MSVTLGVIALQLATGYINTKRQCKLSSKVAAAQQAFEEKATLEGIERARDEFNRLCALQREIDMQMQQDRIIQIQKSFYSDLDLIAYSESLKNFPLLVPPFVMKNESLPILPEAAIESKRSEKVSMHCILTNCMDTHFNTTVFPELEERLSNYFCKYWNIGSSRPILFYQGGWRDKRIDARSSFSNLKSELGTLPTLVISPIITKENGLRFEFLCWGMGTVQNKPESFVPIGLKFNYQPNYNYSDDEKKYVLDELVPSLAAFISFFADRYYWNYYRMFPILPSLIVNKKIELNPKSRDEYVTQYIESMNSPANYGVEKFDYVDCFDELLYLYSVRNTINSDLYNDKLDAILCRLCKLKGVEHNDSISFSKLLTMDNFWEPKDYKILALLSKTTNFKPTKKIEIMEKKNVKMDGNLYNIKRDELLRLLNETLELPNLPEDTKREFLRIQKKCLENQYSLILIGEFQGGKSTTFDALCGGREISPRGALTKTSACKITATNLSSNEDEYAEVHWKTSAELILGIQSIFAKRITKEDLGLSENEIFTPSLHLDLKNSKHVQLMREAIEQEWDYLEKNQNAKDYDDQLEIVKIADLILTFFNNSVIIQQSKKTKTSIEDVSKLIVFPESWDENWENGKNGAKKFKPDEVLFAFIAKVDCHIHSKQLERLGCSIVDCPGLFASAWDTKVAQETIPEGDAILYLLGGEKQMTDGDKKALREIKYDNPSINNIFFTINQKQNEAITRNFIPKNISTLKGLEFDINDIKIYHALLFYLGQFGIAYLANEIDDHTIKRFKSIANKFGYQAIPLNGIWCKMVSKIGSTIDDNDLMSIRDLTPENASLVLRKSEKQALFSEIEEFIIGNKAYSILVENGANKAYEALVSFEERLKQKEEDAQRTTAQRQAEFQRRRLIYDQFINDTQNILQNSFSESVILPIVNNAYMNIFQDSDTINRIALKCSVDLLPVLKSRPVIKAALAYKANKALKREEEALLQQQKVKELVAPIFKLAIEEVINGKMNTWIHQIMNGSSSDYQKYFVPELERVEQSINEKWAGAIEQCNYLKGYSIPKSTKIPKDLSIPPTTNIINIEIINSMGDIVTEEKISDILQRIINGIIGMYVGVIIDLIFTGGAVTLIGGIIGLIVGLIGKPDDTNEGKEPNLREELNKKGQKLYDSIQTNLFKQFNEKEFVDKMKFGEKGLEFVPNLCVECYKNYFGKQLINQKLRLEDDILKAEIEFEEAHENLDRIAEEAMLQREEYVHPLTIKINSFINSVVNGKS